MGGLNILVTGGAGFIGSNLTRILVELGHNVIIVKRKSTNISRLNKIIDKIKIHEADITDISLLEEVFKENRIDILYHLATYYKPNHIDSDIYPMINTNIIGTNNLLELCAKYKVNYFVNTGSCAEYKLNRSLLQEENELSPLNLYAATKIAAEDIINYYTRFRGLNVVTLRLFPPYGPNDNPKKLIPYIIISALKGEEINISKGEQRWDYIYIEDVVNAYIKLLSYTPRGHEIFNVGTGSVNSIKEIVNIISKILGKDISVNFGAIPYRKNEVFYQKADITKIANTLGWYPEYNIWQGLEKTIEFYRRELDL